MKEILGKITYFFHVTDGQGRLDLIDLSFIATMGKILLSPGIDFTAVCAMVPVIIAKMHKTHLTFNRPELRKQPLQSKR